jgi:anthranilate synthase component 2
MILIVDNFDSFTCNLADYLYQLGADCEIRRNDSSLKEICSKKYNAVVISPGPGSPQNSGALMEIIDHFHAKLPILGICLGHQALGYYFGAKIKKAILPKHGKISKIQCLQDPLFNGIPSSFNVVRYHSLILEELPQQLKALAYTEEGEIMAFRHREYDLYGLQYHPEAALTEFGKEVLKNWIFLHKIVD